MSVEDLFKPRYKVITDWPGRTDFVVGEIVTLDKEFSPKYNKYEITDCRGTRSYINSFFKMFPLQFKELKWWEERLFAKLPMYIHWYDPSDKNNLVSTIFKVEDWYSNPNTSQIAGVYVNGGNRLFIEDCIPATESEYLNQKKETIA